jgi:hypothetical protein
MVSASGCPAFLLEFLGPKERVKEIGSEQHGDAQASKGFVQLVLLSKASAGARIGAHHGKEKNGETNINEIGHEPLRAIR